MAVPYQLDQRGIRTLTFLVLEACSGAEAIMIAKVATTQV
jgi:hypothetical protein